LAVRRDNKVVTEEWERVKELFETALDCPPEHRAEFLSRLEQDDPAVVRQVSDLIASHERAGDFLHQPLIFASNFLDDLEEPQRFAPNDVLCNRFKIVRLIGKGGMGEVYEAFDQELEEHVALKTLRFEVSSNEIFTARFRREIQLARKVTHPNVCRIFESLRHQAGNETISVLSMELLQGQTLGDYLKSKGRLTADEALPLARQIIEGLSAVHTAGIIHRDLKPSNLALVPEGDAFRVKITDFGIAGRLLENPSQPALTQASKILGTPDYMAPEQLEQGRATIQSDIYSLGLVL
jgi:serine/threonine protein kinase